jgi:predicted metal-dependent HD superfamily phosphohydrolase
MSRDRERPDGALGDNRIGMGQPMKQIANSARWMRWVEEPHRQWTWSLLSRLYDEPHRRYHTLAHIGECLALLDRLPDCAGLDRDAAELALWWHDAVYVPADKRNEVLSARLLEAIGDVLVVPSTMVAMASTCIHATRAHTHSSAMPTISVVVDIDLSILAAEPEVYGKYVQEIREEYASVSDEAWRHGRSHFLKEMVGKPRIFSELVDATFEGRARANMQQELGRLEERP